MTTTDDWKIGTPEEVGLEGSPLAALSNWLDSVPGSNVHSVLVVRHGTLAFEHYRTGDDERWGAPLPDVAHAADVKHDIRSVTKIITGLLVGCAIEAKLLPGIDMPFFDALPDYADLRTADKDGIQIRYLLTMSAGLAWDENGPVNDPNHGEFRLWHSDDRIRTALAPNLVAAPGATWTYSGGCTALLGAILERATGQPLDAFADAALFAPLAISDVEWARHRDNAPSASGGLRMRSRDLAKVGQCVIDGGRWQGRQLIPASWITESLSPQIGCHDRLFYYGYHWWLGRSLVKRADVAWAAGIGLGGQRLFVIPKLDMVVVITAGHYGDGLQSWLPLAVLNRFVLAAV
ncbi:MAG: serine hydrolase [Pseudomonadota bacterium]